MSSTLTVTGAMATSFRMPEEIVYVTVAQQDWTRILRFFELEPEKDSLWLCAANILAGMTVTAFATAIGLRVTEDSPKLIMWGLIVVGIFSVVGFVLCLLANSRANAHRSNYRTQFREDVSAIDKSAAKTVNVLPPEPSGAAGGRAADQVGDQAAGDRQ